MAGEELRLTADLITAHLGRWTAVKITQLCSDGKWRDVARRLKEVDFKIRYFKRKHTASDKILMEVLCNVTLKSWKFIYIKIPLE